MRALLEDEKYYYIVQELVKEGDLKNQIKLTKKLTIPERIGNQKLYAR